jgi:hypothetical protein
MATTLMFSVCGSPGITTAAVAATRRWYRNSILLEADTSRASAVLSGYLKGTVTGKKSLINLAVAAAQAGRIDFNDMWAQLHPLDSDNVQDAQQWVLPGLMDPKSAPSLDHLWGDVISAADTFESAGTDVIIDAGRWNVGDVRSALMRSADAVVLVARPTMPDAFAVRSRLEDIRATLGEIGHSDHLSILTVEKPGTEYPPTKVASSLGLRLIGSLPWDDKCASVFSDGAHITNNGRFEKRPYIKAVDSLVETLHQDLDRRRSLLNEALDNEVEELS